MSELAKTFTNKEEQSYSLTQAIIQLKDDTTKKDNSIDEEIVSLRGSLTQTNNNVADLTDDMGDRGDYQRVYTEIANLHTANSIEKEARESADTTLTTNLNKEIGDREAADTTLTTNLNKEISDREEAIRTINTILGNKGDTNDSVYVEIGKLHTKDSSIDEDIKKINDTIGPAETLGSVYSEIRKLQASDTNIENAYKAADTNIVNTYIGTKPEGWNPLYTEIDNIKNVIGTKPEGGNPLYTEISNIKNDITTKDAATNARFGEGITAENTVAAQLSALREYANGTFLTQVEAGNTYLTQTNASNTYVTRAEANDTYAKSVDYVSKVELDTSIEALNKYAKTVDYVSKTELDTSIEALDKYMTKDALGDSLNTLITSVQTSNPESGQVSISTLEDLLNKIVGMEAEIERLNGEIESLKTPSTEGTEE